jgi:hypothetical protein
MSPSRFVPPTVELLALDHFISKPGHSSRPGEIVEVPNHVANTLITMGKARLLTAEDRPSQPQKIVSRDPTPVHRDPIPTSRRKR